jgi:hypothetical protein
VYTFSFLTDHGSLKGFCMMDETIWAPVWCPFTSDGTTPLTAESELAGCMIT